MPRSISSKCVTCRQCSEKFTASSDGMDCNRGGDRLVGDRSADLQSHRHDRADVRAAGAHVQSDHPVARSPCRQECDAPIPSRTNFSCLVPRHARPHRRKPPGLSPRGRNAAFGHQGNHGARGWSLQRHPLGSRRTRLLDAIPYYRGCLRSRPRGMDKVQSQLRLADAAQERRGAPAARWKTRCGPTRS